LSDFVNAAVHLTEAHRARQIELLEQAEQFKDDHYNDNYSDYVKDASVHGGDSVAQ